LHACSRLPGINLFNADWNIADQIGRTTRWMYSLFQARVSP